jgi:hypothetical protein
MDDTRSAGKLETVTRRRLLQTLGAGGMALAAGIRPAAAHEDHPGEGLRTRLTRSYGLEHPFVSAGMGFVGLPPMSLGGGVGRRRGGEGWIG